MTRKALRASLIAVLLLTASGSALAAGPYFVDTVDNSGTALRWTDDRMVVCVETGDLADSVSNGTAVGWITNALNLWSNASLMNKSGTIVKTTTVDAEVDSGCGLGDITIDNYWDHVNDVDGKTVIIFDKTGEIIADMYQGVNTDYVVGLSAPIAWDDSGLHITEAFAVFNGKIIDSGFLAADDVRAQALYKGTITHELGHMLNLDHAQINYDIAGSCDRNPSCTQSSITDFSCECTGGVWIPTMYPNLVTALQGYNLHRDDIVSISQIYPSEDFENDFCTITGEIFDADGNPLKGVNVIAKNMQSSSAERVDARSNVSGVLWTRCIGNGRYNLRGIKPGVPYTVEYEGLGSEFTGASGFEPLVDDSPFGSYSGTIENPSGETTVYCENGGETIPMASVTVDTYNYCAVTDNVDQTTGGTSSGTSKTCSLGEQRPHSAPLGMLLLLLLALAPRLRRASLRIDS